MSTSALRSGTLTFTADDQGEGPLVMCLHGFPDHRGTWRHQRDALVRAGYRVVTPSIRGYEPSSQPEDGDYRLARLGEDVVAWLDDLGQGRVHLVGHDWGAAISTVAANMAPDRVASLTTLAVPPLQRMAAVIRARPGALTKLWYMAFFQLRGVAERALLARDGALVRRLWRDWSPGWSQGEEAIREVIDGLKAPGVAQAALRYYRHLPDLISADGRRSWALLRATVKVPTLMLVGEQDGCMDARLYDVAVDDRDFPAGSEVERIAGAGHFLHQERPEVVNRLLLRWLAAHP